MIKAPKIALLIKKFLYYNFNLFQIRENFTLKDYGEFNQQQEIFEGSHITLGIVKEKWGLHRFFIKACRELKISYKVINFFSNKWYEEVNQSNIDILFMRPSVQYSPWKEMFDNRLRILLSNIKIKIHPNVESLWIWESKLRTLEWLKINNIPHPKSEIYYDEQEIVSSINSFRLPIVYKSNIGSGSSGVKIITRKKDLKKIVRKVFKKGIRTYRKHFLDKEHGFIILQEFLADAREWRIVRIGDYYFGFEKIISGNFHSGSHSFGYGMPPLACLDLVKDLTDKHDFRYISIDLFITKNNEIFVNEIQPYFAQKNDRELLVINGNSGALKYDEKNKEWKFKAGKFCSNNMANLRIKEVLKEFNSND